MTVTPAARPRRERPVVGVLLGDPGGVGPELAVKLLARPGNLGCADVAVLGDPKVLALGEKAAGVALEARQVAQIGALAFEHGRPTLVPFDWIADDELALGRATPASGRAVLASLTAAAKRRPAQNRWKTSR